MRGAELYDRVVNWPNPMQLAVVFAVGAEPIMTAALLLSLGRLRVFARVLTGPNFIGFDPSKHGLKTQ